MPTHKIPCAFAADRPIISSVSTLFNHGTRSAAAKDFGQALSYFQQAEKAGDTRPALYYNIGVCAFKEGKYIISGQAFLKTAETPKMTAISYYNLGLIAIKEKKPAAAEQWFLKTLKISNDLKLRTLAAKALTRIGSQQKAETNSSWQYLSAGFGYDDNTELASDTSSTSGQGDSYAEAFFYYKTLLPDPGFTRNLNLKTSLYYQKFSNLNEYDLGMIKAGLFHSSLLGTWKLESGFDYAYLAQDGKSYEHLPTVSLYAKKKLANQTLLNFRYRLSYLNFFEGQYQYLDGWRQSFEAYTVSRIKDLPLTLGYTFELNDRDNDDYSARRHQFKAGIGYSHNKLLKLYGAIKYRISDYDYTAGEKRKDKRTISTVRATYSLTSEWDAIIEDQYTDNNSSIAGYDYTRNICSLNLARSF